MSALVYSKQIQQEIDQLPGEYLPMLLQMIRVYRQSVTLPTAQASFAQGWQESQSGQTQDISTLWDGIDAK